MLMDVVSPNSDCTVSATNRSILDAAAPQPSLLSIPNAGTDALPRLTSSEACLETAVFNANVVRGHLLQSRLVDD